MSDELQASEELEQPNLEEQGEVSESAADTGDNPEQETSGEQAEGVAQPDDPARFAKRINQKHFELMEEKRKAQALEQQLSEIKAQLPQEQAPKIPPMPDPYDDNYKEQLEARDKALMEHAQYDARQRMAEEQRQQQVVQQAQQRQAEQSQIVEQYSQRAKELGIEAQELQAAGQTVMAYGISDELADFILRDEQGAAITTHLARNPEQLETLRNMPPMQAAVYIATTVKSGAAQKPKQSAPPPPDTLSGAGSQKAESDFVRRARFE